MEYRQRIWEIDFFRGIAVILMIIFHLLFDLNDYGFKININSGLWYYVGKLSAILFIFISGICVIFGKNNIRRGLFILLLGYMISIITYLNDSGFYIKFGILHFLGICIILYGLMKIIKSLYLLATAVIAIVTGNIINTVTVNAVYLFPIGFMPRNFSSLDYYPLLPWIGIFIFGVIVGRKLYFNRKGLLNFKENFINSIGKHSLIIYFIHQPILMLILKLYKLCVY